MGVGLSVLLTYEYSCKDTLIIKTNVFQSINQIYNTDLANGFPQGDYYCRICPLEDCKCHKHTTFTDKCKLDIMDRLTICFIQWQVEQTTVAVVDNFFKTQRELFDDTAWLVEFLKESNPLMYYAPLSSLSGEDWEEYQKTGRIPDSYDPWNDQTWIRWVFQDPKYSFLCTVQWPQWQCCAFQGQYHTSIIPPSQCEEATEIMESHVESQYLVKYSWGHCSTLHQRRSCASIIYAKLKTIHCSSNYGFFRSFLQILQ